MPINERNSLISDSKSPSSKVIRVSPDEHQQLIVWRDIYNSLVEKFTHFLYNLDLQKIWRDYRPSDHIIDEPLILVFKYRNIGTVVDFDLIQTVSGYWQGRACTINYHNATIILSLYGNTTSGDLIDRFLSEVLIFQGNHSLIVDDELVRTSLKRIVKRDFSDSLDLFLPNPSEWKRKNGID